jgi:hypothetical protein
MSGRAFTQWAVTFKIDRLMSVQVDYIATKVIG